MADNPKTVDDNRPDDPVDVQERYKNVENDNARPAGVVVDTIVIHADAGKKASGSVDWIEDDKSDVSYHTLIERDGDVHRLVEPERRAWHAGKSRYDGRDDVNDFSLGISFANRNDGVERYTELQYQIGAAEVATWIRLREQRGVTFKCSIARITDHATIRTAWNEQYPTKKGAAKSDPGPMFDMEKFKDYVQKTLDGIRPGHV
jgi:N-acetyl-anhydromuramyl-L-alanine amidase AmpD